MTPDQNTSTPAFDVIRCRWCRDDVYTVEERGRWRAYDMTPQTQPSTDERTREMAGQLHYGHVFFYEHVCSYEGARCGKPRHAYNRAPYGPTMPPFESAVRKLTQAQGSRSPGFNRAEASAVVPRLAGHRLSPELLTKVARGCQGVGTSFSAIEVRRLLSILDPASVTPSRAERRLPPGWRVIDGGRMAS